MLLSLILFLLFYPSSISFAFLSLSLSVFTRGVWLILYGYFIIWFSRFWLSCNIFHAPCSMLQLPFPFTPTSLGRSKIFRAYKSMSGCFFCISSTTKKMWEKVFAYLFCTQIMQKEHKLWEKMQYFFLWSLRYNQAGLSWD